MSKTSFITNVASLSANRFLEINGRAQMKSVERLSSGLRINRAGDDAAGLRIANLLRTKVEGITQTIENAANGIQLINIVESSLDETTNRINRIRQLAVQAGNTSVNDLTAREAIQDEIFQNIDEITRIANTTQYTSHHLLNGDIAIQSAFIPEHQNKGLSIDVSSVASTLKGGTSYLNIVQIQQGYSQMIAGDGLNESKILNTGIANSTDIAVTLAHIGTARSFSGAAITAVDPLNGAYFNGVSLTANDIVQFDGVLADGETRFTGAFSIGGSGPNTVSDLIAKIQSTIEGAEKSLFGVDDSALVPSAYHTTVSLGSGSNAGRLELKSQDTFINQSSINFSIARDDYIVSRSDGVTRSGVIGLASGLTGQGQIGNSVTAITGSTFDSGQFEIRVQDAIEARAKVVESTVAFRNSVGTIMGRSVSLGTAPNHSIVLNGSFLNGLYTGGTTLVEGDVITLIGTNSDGSTFTGSFTFNENTAVNDYDTALNDFRFGTISGLIEELNYRTRDYTITNTDGKQTRFEDATFTYASTGYLQLADDIGRSNSQTNFSLTFQRDPTASGRPQYTIQDSAQLIQEGFAESAAFSIDGGQTIRAKAGDVITLKAPETTRDAGRDRQVTLRIGTGLTNGVDVLETVGSLYTGELNNGPKVTFANGDRDVVFIDGLSKNNRGLARFVTVDFDNIIDVTARTDGLPDNGYTFVLSTLNTSVNFALSSDPYSPFPVTFGNFSAEGMGFGRGSGRTVNDIDVRTLEGVNEAFEIVDEALNQLNDMRASFGALSSRLESTINNMSVGVENMTMSESRIRDADIARLSSRYTSQQILLQSSIYVLSQVQLDSEMFLPLLG